MPEKNKIPFLGLGYGMHLAIVEYARHVAGLSQAHTSEVDPHTPHPAKRGTPFPTH